MIMIVFIIVTTMQKMTIVKLKMINNDNDEDCGD